MTWVKICGMTNLEDALVAVDAGADAVGFVFYEKSPRCVTVETVRDICSKLPESVEKIGVFVGGVDSLGDAFHAAGLTGLQHYSAAERSANGGSSEAAELVCFPPRTKLLIAVPMTLAGTDIGIKTLAARYANRKRRFPEGFSPPEGIIDTFVLDSGSLRQPGGTGKTFDWNKAVPVAEGIRQGGAKLVVAGGLTAENVGEAMGVLKPWGVDVVSGVEARPGKKDPEKVRAFVKAVRDFDRKVG